MVVNKIVWATGLFLVACTAREPEYRGIQFAEKILDLSREAEVKLSGHNTETAAGLDTLRRMAEEAGARTRNCRPGRAMVESVNRYLFQELGYQGIAESSSVQDLCLTRVLAAKRGSCLGLVCLYLSLTEIRQWPFSAVLLPGHVFLRCRGDSGEVNIETLRQGLERSDSFYREKFLPGAGPDYYFKNLSPAQVVALVSFNLGNEYRKRKLYEDAEQKYREAVALFPAFVEARENLEHILALESHL
jgi:regulator of sirC expression with transglutaminase-like and TPR domain